MLSAYWNALFPVVFCAGLGVMLARRTSLLDSPELSRLVTLIGLPALILNALFTMTTSLWAVSDTFLAIVATLALSAVIGAAVLRLAGLDVRGYLSMWVNPNTGNLGLPLVFALLGPQAMVHAVVISTVVQISHFTLGVWLLSGRFSVKSLLSNASVMALCVGVAWSSTGWPVPTAVLRTVDILSGMTIPVMLLLLGRSLSSINLRELTRLKRIVGLSIGRVVLGLGAAFLVTQAFALSPLVAHTLMLQASMPVAVISYILAAHYHGPKEDIAAVILVSLPFSLLAVLFLVARF